MNELTKFLIQELLDNPKTVAIYGGGFKPPTKGHFTVVEKALSDFPEIDEFKIFVGSGVRDGITQEESIKIWELYKPYLSNKINIEPSAAPVKSILGYAKDHPDEKVYWILGTREGNEDDLKDIENRTKSLSKYPNIEVVVINTQGGVSGTNTRTAVRNNDKELFFKLIPDIKEKEQIWNLVSPVIKEIVTDTEVICDNCGWEWDVTDGGDDLYVCHKCGHDNTPTPINEVGEANLKPYKWGEVDQESRFIYTQFTTDKGTKYEVDLEFMEFDNPEDEDIVLNAMGVEFMAKREGEQGYSSKVITNEGDALKIMSTVVNIVKYYVKKYKIQAILYSPSKKGNEDFGSQRDKLYKAFIEKALPGVYFEQKGEWIAAILPNNKIKENQNKAWNLQEGMLSLSKYMIDNGMNIKPLPKVKMIKNNKENADNMLGNTAYYNPTEKSITLFTLNRHPKDILRSFSHEMIHHMQNLEGRLNNIQTTNTNEDGDLPELEREAYEKGNMMLRSWEDSIKNV
jgi:hypothetical protein